MYTKAIAITSAIGLVLLKPAYAQELVFGAEQFAERCAVCHGQSGDGTGLVAELFSQKPKDLRTLAQENGGTFPTDRVISAIDGRSDIRGHGNSEMPVWGEYLMVEAIEDRSINNKDARMIVQGRIYALTSYLESIQLE